MMLILGILMLPAGLYTQSTPIYLDPKQPIERRVEDLLGRMTLEEKVGQLTLYTSDYDVTGPTIREGYKDDIKAGKVGGIFNAFGADYTRKLQEMAVKETRLNIPLLFGYDVIHGHKTIFPVPSFKAPAVLFTIKLASLLPLSIVTGITSDAVFAGTVV